MGESSSILARATPADIRLDPFPHIVIRDALPAALYGTLAECYPDITEVAGKGPLKNNTLYLKSALEVIDNPVFPQVWREFFAYHCSRAFYLEVVALWRSVIEHNLPFIATNRNKPLDAFTCGIRRSGASENPDNLREDMQLDCQFGVNSPVHKVTSVRGPHVDSRFKLFAGLLYFRAAGDDSTGGELELYRYRDPALRYHSDRPIDAEFVQQMQGKALNRIEAGLVEKTEIITYEPNTFVMWLNTPHSVHGVSPRGRTNWPRRYVNFLGESYDSAGNGYFAIKKRRHRWAN